MRDGVTYPEGRTVECRYCGAGIPAQREEHENYHEGGTDVYYNAREDMKGILWDYLMGNTACIGCYKNRAKILHAHVLKDVHRCVEIIPFKMDRALKEYQEVVDKSTGDMHRYGILIDVLTKYPEITPDIPEDDRKLILEFIDGSTKREIEKIFDLANRSLVSSCL